MKLYTEEQVRLLLNEILTLSSSVDDAIDSLAPIELPSDEEIENAAKKYAKDKRDKKQLSNREFDLSRNDFINSAKWMKEQILNQNK